MMIDGEVGPSRIYTSLLFGGKCQLRPSALNCNGLSSLISTGVDQAGACVPAPLAVKTRLVYHKGVGAWGVGSLSNGSGDTPSVQPFPVSPAMRMAVPCGDFLRMKTSLLAAAACHAFVSTLNSMPCVSTSTGLLHDVSCSQPPVTVNRREVIHKPLAVVWNFHTPVHLRSTRVASSCLVGKRQGFVSAPAALMASPTASAWVAALAWPVVQVSPLNPSTHWRQTNFVKLSVTSPAAAVNRASGRVTSMLGMQVPASPCLAFCLPPTTTKCGPATFQS